jgi:putative redox protein
LQCGPVRAGLGLWRPRVREEIVPIAAGRRERPANAGQCGFAGQVEVLMKVRTRWVEGVSFVGESGSGHTVVIDGSPDDGGRNLGMRPMELVLLGAAACTAFDVVLILRKARQPVADCSVEAQAERADTVPRVFTRIHFNYAVAGRGLDRAHVERAVKLSKDKYCSATQMLGKTAEITYAIAIIEGDRVPLPGEEKRIPA